MNSATSIYAMPVIRPRWYRSVGAVLAGLLLNAFLSSGTDLLLVALGVFPPLRDFGNPAAHSDSLLLLALIYRTGFGVLGCYVTARLAGSRPMAHALALGGIGVLIGTLGAIATWQAWTHWYQLAIIAVTLPSSWLGARIYLARR
ncbi:hypothetical protein [Steroidobacter agaridevorans]|uniref:hypothetical protein n=1 Tax=Steroidobacter agaridevorans TaxID=2695856 RepID=UPI0013218260|nr:hypothetical protein [Steroidobacter agaridevorans]GFE85764.1 hypothetical protein GCM10011488_07180 [Steroidobacter agaridevorans]